MDASAAPSLAISSPGTLLLGRYRIISLVGRGGMGEVYRAEDLKLGEEVALKFLPAALEANPAFRIRFVKEVRIARQVTHPNVCRVHDIAEVEGRFFLSMEYVDGEDLKSLLTRVGRLPAERVIQIAYQLFTGLDAAHRLGILHRDLKPTNIMVDSRGNARITDFGLAGIATEFVGEELFAGTPAYMAPEQLNGLEVTVRSDLYSLGLVLYELITGQPPWSAVPPEQAAHVRRTSAPVPPSRVVPGVDADLEQAVLWCLRPLPEERPPSAREVSAILPGGSPLAYTRSMGETPSPELVAGIDVAGALPRAQAWACLAGVAIGLVCVMLLSQRVQLIQLVPSEKPPAVLIDRARSILARLGGPGRPTDWSAGLMSNPAYLGYIERHDPSPGRWERLKRGSADALQFWYRESPAILVVRNAPLNRIEYQNPPQRLPGMRAVVLDPEGRLRSFTVVPPRREESARPDSAPDWPAAFAEAGLDIGAFRPAAPTVDPPFYADTRASWVGVLPEAPDIPLRIEAAARRGALVSFSMIYPWTVPERAGAPDGFWGTVTGVTFMAATVLVIATGAFLARRNWRRRRGDRKGAVAAARICLALGVPAWLFASHHVPAIEEVGVFYSGVAWVLLSSAALWMFYLALEPDFRRLWPRTIVSAMRFLGGRYRDPLVGRDVLFGCMAGVGMAVMSLLFQFLPRWLGHPPPRPDSELYSSPADQMVILGGLGQSVGWTFAMLSIALNWALDIAVGLLVIRVLVRRTTPAVILFGLVLTLYVLRFGIRPSLDLVYSVIYTVMVLWIMLRLGVFPAIVALCGLAVCLAYPMTMRFSSWYAAQSVLGLAIIVLAAGYGFYVALAGRPMLGEAVVDSEPSAPVPRALARP